MLTTPTRRSPQLGSAPSAQPRKFVYLGIIICLSIFLICSNMIHLHRNPCVRDGRHFWISSPIVADEYSGTGTGQSGSGPEYTPSAPAAPSAIATNSYVFTREASLITRLTMDSNVSKTSIDLLINIRKLTLFAAHELNKVTRCPTNTSERCPKWWTNPLNTLALKTHRYPPRYEDHDLTFLAEPDGIPVFVRIRQLNLSSSLWVYKSELEVRGKFARLDGEEINLPPKVDESMKLSNDTATLAPVSEEDKFDPVLFSWPRNQSFLVGDYVDFKNKSVYLLSPGRRRNSLTNVFDLYCGTALKMLIMVSSAPKHFEQRRAIRETYGSAENLKGKDVRLVFLFGVVTDKSLQAFLDEEANEHDDLIQANFMDSYHNLSLSHLLMYNWIQTTCQGRGLPKYVLKADDDFFLNVELALRVAYENPKYELMGTAYCGTVPVRNIAYMTKYYTPRYMYMAEKYVGYLSGVAYIFRSDIIPRMLKVSLTTPMIHMDDVYITGLVARQLNIPPMGSQLFTYGRSELNPCSMRKMVSSYALSIDDLRAQWKEFIQPIPENCSLDATHALIPIKPFRPQDNVACILE